MTRTPRLVHLGVGAFARAHLAWYTQHADPDADGTRWGITAFTGRSPAAADALTAQGCRYTLVTRAADGDTAETIDAIVAAHPGDDADAWRAALASPSTAIVTLTVTEAGYRPGSGIAARIADGLAARRDAGGGPLAIASLDNLAGNGAVLRDAVLAAARERSGADGSDDLAAWIEDTVAFPTSMVDRITPATTDEDVALVASLPGALDDDGIPVVTEPFSEWVTEDAWPAGRPDWESAGVRVVDDVEPYEQRKLWLLNGAHSLLAYAGLVAGHETVAEAMADPVCRDAVEALWDEAAALLPLPDDEIAAARAALEARFANPRIRHTLAQIAAGGSEKLPVRVVAPLAARLARDPSAGVGPGAATALAAWWLHVTTQPELVSDPGAPDADASLADALAVVAPDLAVDVLEPAVAAAAARLREAAARGAEPEGAASPPDAAP